MNQDSTSPARSPSYKWWVVFMLWFVCLFNYADRQAISAVFPVLEAEFGFSKFELGLIGSAFMWVYALGGPFAGYVGDRVRRKDLILGGCLFWSVVTMMTGWCGRLWQFVTVRALEGFGETFYFPASMSLMSDYHGPESRSRALAFHQSSVYAGTIAGSWLGAWIAEHYGWRLGFYAFGGGGIILALILFTFLREPRRGESEGLVEGPPEPPMSWREVAQALLRSPTAPLLMAAFLAANFVATIFLTWTPTFLVEKFGYKLAAAGLSGSVFIQLASAVGSPLGGIFADRLGSRWTGGRIVIQALGLLSGALCVFLVGTAADVPSLIGSMVLFGLCKGFYDSNIFASLYDTVEPRARATAAGLMNTVGWGGGALGPVFVGWVATNGRHPTEVENMSEAIASCGLAYLAGAVLLILAVASLRRDRGRSKGV
ncbi:MFS transporter [Tundrisphaera lichenicola]|uniref:MFS transporter n=1 Tax=Tundrisphaera lichenicola TaxID=2029860 RepID=UPI003EBC6B61